MQTFSNAHKAIKLCPGEWSTDKRPGGGKMRFWKASYVLVHSGSYLTPQTGL